MKLGMAQFACSFDSGRKDGDQVFLVRTCISRGEETIEVVGSSNESYEKATWMAFKDLCKRLGLNVEDLYRMDLNGTSNQPIITLEYKGRSLSGSAEDEHVPIRAYFKALILAISSVVPDKVTT